MSSPFADILWAPAELPLLIEALAGKSGIPCRESPGLAGPGPEMAPGAWVGYACGRLGIDCEAVDLWGVVAEERLRAAAPALVPAGEGWLGLLAVRGRHAFLLTPRLSVHRIRFAELRALVTGEIE